MKQGTTSVTKYLAAAVALTALAMSGSAMAGIQSSVHDFSAKTFTGGDGTTQGSGEICVVCHAPHNNQNAAGELLWNHDMSSATYTMYSNAASLDATLAGSPTGVSKLCLSCHDGTVAVDSFGGATGSIFVGDISGNTKVDLGANLSNDHPISFTYDAALVTADGALNAITTAVTIGDGTGGKTKAGTIETAMLVSGEVQCSSCHDVHNNYTTTSGKLLKIANTGSGLCLTCHNK